MLIHLSEAQTTPMPRTGEIHEMKPNKTGETAIHLEVYSSIHTVYLPTRGHKASTRDTTIQHDTAIHLYNAIQCIGCITTPQVADTCPRYNRSWRTTQKSCRNRCHSLIGTLTANSCPWRTNDGYRSPIRRATFPPTWPFLSRFTHHSQVIIKWC